MLSKRNSLFFLMIAFFCLFGAEAFPQILNKAYVGDVSTLDWPVVSLAPEGNKYLIGDKLVILVNLENHGRVNSAIDPKISKLVFYFRGDSDKDWKMVLPDEVKLLSLPDILESGHTAFFARVVFGTKKLQLEGRFKVYAEVLGLNLKSGPVELEIYKPSR
jgi:hypothetical protein